MIWYPWMLFIHRIGRGRSRARHAEEVQCRLVGRSDGPQQRTVARLGAKQAHEVINTSARCLAARIAAISCAHNRPRVAQIVKSFVCAC
jgi:hypothetical protein